MAFPDMHDFATNRQNPIRRSTFNKPARHNGTCDQGDLVPFYLEEVIAGSTFNVHTSFDLKMLKTPFVPVMDDAYIDGYYFFVPSRILWKKWPQLFGTAEPSAWDEDTELVLPSLGFDEEAVTANSSANALGLPIGFDEVVYNPLPFLALAKIYDDWFRDENVQSSNPLIEEYYEAASGDSLITIDFYDSFYKVNKYHDYFTSVLPKPQKVGDPVKLPLGDAAPLVDVNGTAYPGVRIYGNFAYSGQPGMVISANTLSNKEGTSSSKDVTLTVNAGTGQPFDLQPFVYGNGISSNFVADLSNATAADINDLRLAIALQVYYEQLARGGSRYNELLKTLFGVAPMDATLQRPEFLGGFHKKLNMSQVPQTGNRGDIATGNMPNTTGALGAYSNTFGSEGSFVKSFDEPGYVIGVFAIRVKHRYSQGLRKLFMKNGRFDFFIPTFDRLGEVPVLKNEIYFNGIDNDAVLGFMPAWSEYRMSVDWISGAITPGQSTDLQAWTYGDLYSAQPTLSAAWLAEPKTNIEQTVVGASSVPQFIFDFYVQNKVTAPISVDSVPNTFGF